MSTQVSSIGTIFLTTWNLYKRRALPILVVSLLAVFFAVLLVLALGFSLSFIPGIDFKELERLFAIGGVQEILLSPIWAAVGMLFFFAAALSGCWCQAAILAVAVDEERGIFASLCAGWKYFFPLLWVGSLYTGIILSGFGLLIIPGLILTLSLSFCFYSMIGEDLPGIDAVLASRLYVRGHWWNTLLKLLLIWLIFISLNLIPILGQFLALLFYPFTLLYTVAIYRDLKQAAGKIDLNFSFRWFWVLMAAAGILLPLLGAVGAAVTIGPKLPEKIKQAAEIILKKIPEKDMVMDFPPAPAVRQLPSLDGFLIWRDPVGDTSNPLLDIREVSAIGEHGNLQLAVTLAQDFAAYFTASTNGDTSEPLLSFYLDTDMNSETGRLPLGGGQRGYDVEIEVFLTARPDGAAGQAHVHLYQLDGPERRSLGEFDEAARSLVGSTLSINLPYSRINAATGDTIRICFREAAQQLGHKWAKDQSVPLR